MKTILTYILTLCLLAISFFAQSQNNLKLQIKHKLNAYDFELGKTGMNIDSTIFRLDRLQYYMSEIEIEHDGGQITPINDFWVLVDAAGATQVNLGMQSIAEVERIRFSIGVDSAHNYLDPAQYSLGHSLGLTSPSMHWGWAAGYRFVAAEGEDEKGTGFEIHALGGKNYFQTEVEVGSEMVNGDNIITIYGNYSRGFDEIDLTSGLINHSEEAEAQSLLINYSLNVFSAIEPTDSFRVETTDPTGIEDNHSDLLVSVSPNPAQNGTIVFSVSASASYSAQVFDITGKEVFKQENLWQIGKQRVTNLESGLYFLVINDNVTGNSITKKVILK